MPSQDFCLNLCIALQEFVQDTRELVEGFAAEQWVLPACQSPHACRPVPATTVGIHSTDVGQRPLVSGGHVRNKNKKEWKGAMVALSGERSFFCLKCIFVFRLFCDCCSAPFAMPAAVVARGVVPGKRFMGGEQVALGKSTILCPVFVPLHVLQHFWPQL